MSTPARISERLTWFNGSVLAEHDLDDAVAYESRMLELHIQGVHRTWGVAHGLTIALSNDAREVLVSPGFAYTCRGEALIIAELTHTAPPASATAGTYDLLLVPPLPAEAGKCERPVTCTGETIVRRAALRWERAGASSVTPLPLGDSVRLGTEIPIARFMRLASGVLVGPDMHVRRVARGLVRPHVAFGVTRPGELIYTQGTTDISAAIDTSAAGFSVRPFYFVTLGSAAWPGGFAGPFVSIAQASTTSFRVHLQFGRPGAGPVSMTLFQEIATHTPLSWVGVEPVLGCPPALSLLQFLALGLSQSVVSANWSNALAKLMGTEP